jgi:hypothetical protein
LPDGVGADVLAGTGKSSQATPWQRSARAQLEAGARDLALQQRPGNRAAALFLCPRSVALSHCEADLPIVATMASPSKIILMQLAPASPQIIHRNQHGVVP